MSTESKPEPDPNEPDPNEPNPNESKSADPLRVRYRIRFTKTGLLRWTSHRDLARLWERLVRRAQLVLSMTEGFHPKPRIGFPSALALGTESLDEVVELDLAEEMPVNSLLDRLCEDEQPGLTIKSVQQIPLRAGKAKLDRTQYEIRLPTEIELSKVESAIADLLATESVTVQRKKKPLTVNVAEQISELSLNADVGNAVAGNSATLHLELIASDSASLRPTDVIDLLDGENWIENGASIVRTVVILRQETEPDDKSPIAVAVDGNKQQTHSGQEMETNPIS